MKSILTDKELDELEEKALAILAEIEREYLFQGRDRQLSGFAQAVVYVTSVMALNIAYEYKRVYSGDGEE